MKIIANSITPFHHQIHFKLKTLNSQQQALGLFTSPIHQAAADIIPLIFLLLLSINGNSPRLRPSRCRQNFAQKQMSGKRLESQKIQEKQNCHSAFSIEQNYLSLVFFPQKRGQTKKRVGLSKAESLSTSSRKLLRGISKSK